MFVADLVTSRSRLEAQILFLRHQSASGGRLLDLNRAESSCFDGWLIRLWSNLIDAVHRYAGSVRVGVVIVETQPEMEGVRLGVHRQSIVLRFILFFDAMFVRYA